MQTREIKVEVPVNTDLQFVFFAGDVLSNKEKEAVGFELGGKVMPSKTLLNPSQLLRRCEIGVLEKTMEALLVADVPPNKRSNYVSRYTSYIYNSDSGQYEQKTIDGGKKFLYKEIYPVNELNDFIKGKTGVVIVPCQSLEEREQAQLHYFPNWNNLVLEVEVLPKTLRELEAHLKTRRDLCSPSSNLYKIGNAFIQSCRDFKEWGTRYLKNQTSAVKASNGKLDAFVYDDLAERLFEMLEMSREDNLLQVTTANNNMMAEAINNQTKMLGQVLGQNAPQGVDYNTASAVIAEKDAEIERLRAELAQRNQSTASGQQLAVSSQLKPLNEYSLKHIKSNAGGIRTKLINRYGQANVDSYIAQLEAEEAEQTEVV